MKRDSDKSTTDIELVCEVLKVQNYWVEKGFYVIWGPPTLFELRVP
jgi:hypothetical protein